MSAYWVLVASGGIAAFAIGVARTGPGERLRQALVLGPALLVGMAAARALYVWLHPGAPLLGRQGQMLDGALLGIALAVPMCSRLVGMPPLRALDLLAPGIGVGIAIARLGCLVNGCCLGVPTSLPWGVAAPGADATLQTVPFLGQIAIQPLRLHPSPVYEMLLALLAAGVVLWVVRRSSGPNATSHGKGLFEQPGIQFFAFLFVLESGRALLAAFRQPDPASRWPSEWISAAIAACCGFLLAWALLTCRKAISH